MAARSPQPSEAEWFTAPAQVNRKRYEALRAYFTEHLTYARAAERFGYTRWAMIDLARQHRAGKLELFAPPRRPGPPPGVAPAKDRVRGRVIELRRQGLSAYEISGRLKAEGTPLNRTSVGEILAGEGFGRLLRRPGAEASISPATPMFAGMAVLPKKSALTDYSYRLSHDHQQKFLAALDTQMIGAGLAAREEAVFDLDFHAVMHWGRDPVLEKHYVPTRSQRARSVLTFFAQDTGTHNLVYASADISKATQAREVITFCDHWKSVSGADPKMLIMDQKVTTQQVLGELDERGVKFATLRMRSPSLIKYINRLAPADYTTITLDRPGPHNRPRVHEDPAVKLTSYPGTVRQLVLTGLGRDAPTVIITNDDAMKTRDVITQYARRMTIEQRLAEIIRAFCADALSSTVNLNVNLDVMLAVLAQALTAALRARLPGYATATPDTLQRRFLNTRGEIITSGDVITVRLSRRTYSPVLRQADLPPATKVPWWGNRTLRYELA